MSLKQKLDAIEKAKRIERINDAESIKYLSPGLYYKNLSLSNIHGEKWKPIKGFEGYYMVSNLGRIKSIQREFFNGRWNVPVREKIMRQGENHRGYLSVLLNRKTVLVHRAVGIAFIPNPSNKPQINHKLGNKKDNRSSKLEWSTQEENMQHAYDTGLKKTLTGEKHPRSILTTISVKNIRKNYQYGKKGYKVEMSKKYGVSVSAIKDVLKGKNWINN